MASPVLKQVCTTPPKSTFSLMCGKYFVLSAMYPSNVCRCEQLYRFILIAQFRLFAADCKDKYTGQQLLSNYCDECKFCMIMLLEKYNAC